MEMTNINIRTEAEVKAKAQALFAMLGLDMTTAINMFLRQALREQALPFRARIGDDIEATLCTSLAEMEAGVRGYSLDEFSAILDKAIERGTAQGG
jgi:DNA-damage-inducible protein J